MEQSMSLGNMVSGFARKQPPLWIDTQSKFLESPWGIEQFSGLAFLPFHSYANSITWAT